jgi:hypothetical protein
MPARLQKSRAKSWKKLSFKQIFFLPDTICSLLLRFRVWITMGFKFLLTVFSLFFLFSGCKKLDTKTDIPSYIKVDSFSVNYTTSYSNGGPGTKNHNFTDVQVSANGKSLGTFPIPSNIPVLDEGDASIIMSPVIKTNGVSSLRTDYPFMKSFTTSAKLVRGQQSTVTPTFDYLSSINFRWTENFEGAGFSIVGVGAADTSFRRSLSDKFEGNAGLEIKLYNGKTDCRVKSSLSFFLPSNSTDVYLELNYKANQAFEVGLIGSNASDIRSAGGVNATSSWKKMYIFLTPVINANPVSSYTVFFYVKNEGGTPQINIDNIKLISRT